MLEEMDIMRSGVGQSPLLAYVPHTLNTHHSYKKQIKYFCKIEWNERTTSIMKIGDFKRIIYDYVIICGTRL